MFVSIMILLLLGLVQGLTEFLPVSSSGHLVFLSYLFNVEDSLFLSIVLHIATLISVLIVFYKDVWEMIKHPFSEETLKLVTATIPTCIIALLFSPLFDSAFEGLFLPFCFMISAVLLILTEIFSKGSLEKDLNFKVALFMGIAQGLAIFPGISRSGATICTGTLCRANKAKVAKFSFLMSIPIIVLSMLMEVYEIVVNKVTININIIGLILSFIVAVIVGVFSIKFMIRLTTKANFKWFGVYLGVMSILSFIIIYLTLKI
ncbi:MAG: undecaprenyl-diphosphate phosphatase [Clostridia bacterium]|nr:undecaprenyl-diphosphate phosphatase [Clostridia bacterium]